MIVTPLKGFHNNSVWLQDIGQVEWSQEPVHEQRKSDEHQDQNAQRGITLDEIRSDRPACGRFDRFGR